LAKQDDAVIHLLHVCKLPIVPEGMGEYVISDRIKLQAPGDQIIAVAQDEARRKGVLHVLATVREGDLAEAIIAHAKEHDVDRIVMGSRGLGRPGALEQKRRPHDILNGVLCFRK
jgi:nucleotide-binding universal stress UspA family protein